jgi:hypothetical protein
MKGGLAAKKRRGTVGGLEGESDIDMTSKSVITIPKEKAVFRLDRHGNWHTDEGKFTNRNIIRYFHSMIRKDEDGYFLRQEREQVIEKVYFSFEDTALFVFRVDEADGPVLCLNTGEKLRLDPEQLFVKDDTLYVRRNDEIIKFTQDGMLALSDRMELIDDRYVIELNGQRRVIPRVEGEGGL